MRKASSVEAYQQIASFQSLHNTLLHDPKDGRLDKPLAYWALASDRRLPLAFLGRNIRDLLNTPFEQLCATPGVGRKKISSLIKLLGRAVKDQPLDDATVDLSRDGKPRTGRSARGTAAFNPDAISEASWQQYRQTVRSHGVALEKLGRLAPSLNALPTVLWQTPLSKYLDYSLAELRQLKTHGEKRVRVILEVFHALHTVLAGARAESHLTLRLMPKFVVSIEQWIDGLSGVDSLSIESVRQSLALPLLRQTQIDCGPTIARLVEGRLGLQGSVQTVRAQSKRLELTRARIYQLLEENEQAMQVRWPEGSWRLAQLRETMERQQPEPEGLELLCAVVDLYFPDEAATARRRSEEDTRRPTAALGRT